MSVCKTRKSSGPGSETVSSRAVECAEIRSLGVENTFEKPQLCVDGGRPWSPRELAQGI